MGKEGTYTGLHADVYRSYSWSTNVLGRKRWYLFPPAVTPYLREDERRTSEVVPDVREVDENKFPNFAKAWKEVLIVEQEEGQTFFVYVFPVSIIERAEPETRPSGWYHQVKIFLLSRKNELKVMQVINLTDCISINHVCFLYEGHHYTNKVKTELVQFDQHPLHVHSALRARARCRISIIRCARDATTWRRGRMVQSRSGCAEG